MKRVFNFTTTALLIFLASMSIHAQKGIEDGSKYGQGEDSVLCLKNLSLYRENAKHGDFEAAYPYWLHVYQSCPKASKNIYLDGVKIFKYKISKAQDAELKSAYVDTLMLLYDARIQYFGQKGNVRGRQGVDLLKYKRNDDIKFVEQAYNYLDESITLGKGKSSDPVIATYLSASLTLYQNQIFDEAKVIEDYLRVSDLIDGKIAAKPGKTKLTELKASMDENFSKQGPSSCETLISYFTAEIEKKPEDASFLSMLTTLLRKRDCTDSELFFNASKLQHKLAPTSESAFNIALMASKKANYEEAINFYKQAVELEMDEVKKADYYIGVASSYQKLGNKASAREFARKTIDADPNYGEAYLLIGRLYAESRNDCPNEELPGAIYWCAVDQFIKAKSVKPELEETANKLILTYSKHFPNKEEAFFREVHEGSSYTVQCWINETTKARFQ